jgi:hypothetical protein
VWNDPQPYEQGKAVEKVLENSQDALLEIWETEEPACELLEVIPALNLAPSA